MKKLMMTLGLFATLLVSSVALYAGNCCGCCKSDNAACCKDGCEKCDCCK